MIEAVVFAIGNSWFSLNVIGVVVRPDFSGDLRVAFPGFGLRHGRYLTQRRQEAKAQMKRDGRQIAVDGMLRVAYCVKYLGINEGV